MHNDEKFNDEEEIQHMKNKSFSNITHSDIYVLPIKLNGENREKDGLSH